MKIFKFQFYREGRESDGYGIVFSHSPEEASKKATEIVKCSVYSVKEVTEEDEVVVLDWGYNGGWLD